MNEGSRVEALYTWLASKPEADVDRLLAAGLEHAEPEYAARIANLLVTRKRETAWTGLVANYDRLPDDVRQRLHEPSVLVRAGIAAAMRGSARQQLNALAVLAQAPTPQLAYLTAEGLRSRSPTVRARSAEVLRVLAAKVLIDAERNRSRDPEVESEFAAERAELVRALRDALNSYAAHRCEPVLDAALWMAGDVRDLIWDLLVAPRGGARDVVERRLDDAEDPRLATFVLLSLAQRGWRARARHILQRWSRPEHLVAIVRCSALLGDPEIRHELGRLNNPPWFTNHGGALAKLPADVRAQVPLWVGHLGYAAEQRLRCLRVWQSSQFSEVHRAAVYALARLDSPEALRLMSGVAARACPMNRFAKWYVAGRRGLKRESVQGASEEKQQRAGGPCSPGTAQQRAGGPCSPAMTRSLSAGEEP